MLSLDSILDDVDASKPHKVLRPPNVLHDQFMEARKILGPRERRITGRVPGKLILLTSWIVCSINKRTKTGH